MARRLYVAETAPPPIVERNSDVPSTLSRKVRSTAREKLYASGKTRAPLNCPSTVGRGHRDLTSVVAFSLSHFREEMKRDEARRAPFRGGEASQTTGRSEEDRRDDRVQGTLINPR